MRCTQCIVAKAHDTEQEWPSAVFANSGALQKRLSKSSSSKSFFTEKKSKNDFVGQEGRTRFLWCLFIFLGEKRLLGPLNVDNFLRNLKYGNGYFTFTTEVFLYSSIQCYRSPLDTFRHRCTVISELYCPSVFFQAGQHQWSCLVCMTLNGLKK